MTAFREKLARRTDASNANRMREDPLKEGDLVLRYDMPRSFDHSRETKMRMKWGGPYRIGLRSEGAKSYKLLTLDGLGVRGTFAGDQLKRFVQDDMCWWTLNADSWLLGVDRLKAHQAKDSGANEFNEAFDQAAPDEGLLDSDPEGGEVNDKEVDEGEDKEAGEYPYPLQKGLLTELEVRIPALSREMKAQYREVNEC